MKNRFIADGCERVQLAPEKLKALRDQLEARYAPELSRTKGFRHLILRWRLGWEYHREARRLHPSPYSLYAGC